MTDHRHPEFVNAHWTVTGSPPESPPGAAGDGPAFPIHGHSPAGSAPASAELPSTFFDETAGRAFSRRRFIKGVIASGASVSAMAYFGSACGRPGEPVQGGVERLVTLNVNGESRRVDVLPQETLAMTLRYKLGLTGTKLGCDRAECGACTVMIDGVTHYSCSTLTHRVRGREVTTVEGLEGPDGELHPVQQGFIDELGPQCGFCTPGQVVAAAALLERNPSPTREEARRALSGNLCRCGAYDHYLNGVMRASERMS
ncbi:MAG: (2Fe-2S)-binding protein [Longimicrobiales bacterium]|nr:(2Fe-2S)-binding protein [Longimicrobiales bacterium]